MQVKLIASMLVFLMAASGSSAAGAANAIRKQPIELFTQSLTAFYSVLNRCQKLDQDVTPIQSSMQIIRMYISTMYNGETPYWALPKASHYISDPELCNYLLYDRMMSYDYARREYMAAYPENEMPPKFNIQPPKNYEYLKNKLKAVDPDRSRKWRPEYDW